MITARVVHSSHDHGGVGVAGGGPAREGEVVEEQR